MRRIAQTIVWVLVGATTVLSASAQGWISKDIGQTMEGSFDDNAGTFTIEANGADIWAAEDAFRFTYFETDGDFELSARVLSLEVTNEWAKSGLMVRDSLDANSPNVFVNLTASHGVKVFTAIRSAGRQGPIRRNRTRSPRSICGWRGRATCFRATCPKTAKRGIWRKSPERPPKSRWR